MDEYVTSLDPRSRLRDSSTAAAHAGAMEQTSLLIPLRLASPVSLAFGDRRLRALIPFCGFGVLSRINGTPLAAPGFGGFAVGSALFLILELSQPFTGVFRVPSGALDQMLDSLNK